MGIFVELQIPVVRLRCLPFHKKTLVDAKKDGDVILFPNCRLMVSHGLFHLPVEAEVTKFLELSCVLCMFFPWNMGTAQVQEKRVAINDTVHSHS